MKLPSLLSSSEKNLIEKERDQLIDEMALDRDDPDKYKKKAEAVRELASAQAAIEDAQTNRLRVIASLLGVVGSSITLCIYESRDRIFTSKVPSLISTLRSNLKL